MLTSAVHKSLQQHKEPGRLLFQPPVSMSASSGVKDLQLSAFAQKERHCRCQMAVAGMSCEADL